MNWRYPLAALALAAPLAAGCKTPPGLTAMERELRYQEDMIYQLQDYIHTYQSHLNACRTENLALRSDEPPTGSRSPQQPRPGETPPRPSAPHPSPQRENGDMEIPDVQLPPLGAQPSPQPPLSGDPFEVVPLDKNHRPLGHHPTPPQARPPLPPSEPEASEIAADLREDVGDELKPVSYQADPPARGPSTAAAVATLSLNGRRTGPYEQDGQPGTDGLQVWLEPKAANGTIVATAGSATIALLDPHQPRSAKPLARWQVSSADLRRHQTYQGIRLRLRWPHQAPPLAQAVLFVRMITEDGLWIYADQTLALDGKGQEDERPLVAKRRPEKPPTVSPTGYDEPVDEPVVTEPVGTEPVGTEPVGTEPVDEPVATKPEPPAAPASRATSGWTASQRRRPPVEAAPVPVARDPAAQSPQAGQAPPAASEAGPVDEAAPTDPIPAAQTSSARPPQRPQWAPIRR